MNCCDESSAPLAARVNRFANELNVLCHQVIQSAEAVSDDVERDVLRRIRRLLSLQSRLVASSTSTATCIEDPLHDRSRASSAQVVVCDAVRCALENILGVPPCDVDRLLLPDAPDLGLMQWDPWRPASPSMSTAVWVRRRHCDSTVPSSANDEGLPLIRIDISTPSAPLNDVAPTPSPQRQDVTTGTPSPSNASTTKKDAIVDEVRRSIDSLKHNAGRLQSQMSSDDATLQSNDDLMQKALLRTTKQTSDIDRVTGASSSSSLASVPGGRVLARVPGLELLWGSVLLPLWAVVRQAVMILVIVGVTVITVMMMLMVPRIYVRVVGVA